MTQGYGDNWLVLFDPAWQRTDDGQPPPEVVVGGWRLDAEGKPGPFEPNPGFVPGSPDSPSDPVDAVLRRVGRGEDVGDQLVPAVRDSMVEIAVDSEGRPVVAPAPDGVPCVGVATAPSHKARVAAENWRSLVGKDLPAVVPPGVGILLNPDGPASFRLVVDALAD
jgi:hypothetical protein